MGAILLLGVDNILVVGSVITGNVYKHMSCTSFKYFTCFKLFKFLENSVIIFIVRIRNRGIASYIIWIKLQSFVIGRCRTYTDNSLTLSLHLTTLCFLCDNHQGSHKAIIPPSEISKFQRIIKLWAPNFIHEKYKILRPKTSYSYLKTKKPTYTFTKN